MATYIAKVVGSDGKTCLKFPKQLCDEYGVEIGDEIDFVFVEDGEVGIQFLHKDILLSLKKRSRKIRK